MSTARLRARTPSARPCATGRLPHHVLRWHKLGRDGSGKCDAAYAGTGATNTVWGVLFEIDCAEKADLDRAEGLGIGYIEKVVRIVTAQGACLARTYQAKADQVDPALRPRPWYKAHVLRGAREHGLPRDYVARIERIEVEP